MRESTMLRPKGRGRAVATPILMCIGLMGLGVASACDGNGGADDGGSVLRISVTSSPPAGGVTDIVWLAEGGRAGDLLLVDIVARDISQEFDGFDAEITFDPLVAEAVGVASGSALESCTALPVLKADNVSNGNANATGTLLISEAITGSPPPGCTLSGLRTLSRITFRARGQGISALEFRPYNGDPTNAEGSRLYRRDPSVPAVAVLFFDSGALIQVRR